MVVRPPFVMDLLIFVTFLLRKIVLLILGSSFCFLFGFCHSLSNREMREVVSLIYLLGNVVLGKGEMIFVFGVPNLLRVFL